MIDVSEIVEDPDFAQEFTVYRSNGSFVKGRWTEGTPTQITILGVVTVMSARELNQLPEGDRIKAAMNFHSTLPIYVTRIGSSPGISDKIFWRGDYYKIFNVVPNVDYGYYKASGERITGA